MTPSTYIASARDLIAAGDIVSLRHAALALRMCCEALTYSKLRSFTKVIPAEALETWQAPQAVKVLLEYDEYADQSMSIFIGDSGVTDPAKMQKLGDHKSLRSEWLKRHYNKLGGFLHHPQNSSKKPLIPSEIASYLSEVLIELEGAARSNILGVQLSENWRFQCQKCEKEFAVPCRKLERSPRVQCIHANCGAEYLVSVIDGKYCVALDPGPHRCSSCGSDVWFQSKNLRLGYRTKCPKCPAEYEIIKVSWGLEKK